jgi:hypothetical protein
LNSAFRLMFKSSRFFFHTSVLVTVRWSMHQCGPLLGLLIDRLVSQERLSYTPLTHTLDHFMHVHSYAAPRNPFVVTAGLEGSSEVRLARIRDLSIAGANFAMPNPFSKGASIFVKIRTDIEFFQSRATVAHSADGVGMTVLFNEVSPPFMLVLQGWILGGMHGAND